MTDVLEPGESFRLLDVATGRPSPVALVCDDTDGALRIQAGSVGFVVEVGEGEVRVLRADFVQGIYELSDRCEVRTFPAPVVRPVVRLGAADCWEVHMGGGMYHPYGSHLGTALQMASILGVAGVPDAEG